MNKKLNDVKPSLLRKFGAYHTLPIYTDMGKQIHTKSKLQFQMNWN